NHKNVEATEMDAIRKLMRISRRDRKRNEEIGRRMGLEDALTNELIEDRSHSRSKDGQLQTTKTIMMWTPAAKRKRGRPQKSWMEA
ncbi:hypothetical protein HHI36_012184, partial [Cryptolaemus montrouzieri]